DSDRGWRTEPWESSAKRPLRLLEAEGPSGLRLPLNHLPADAMRRALLLEISDGALTCFMPPLLHVPFRELLNILVTEHSVRGIGAPDRHQVGGYLPIDLDARWGRLGLTADPGVLAVTLPPCASWHDSILWPSTLAPATAKVGLRSWKADNFR